MVGLWERVLVEVVDVEVEVLVEELSGVVVAVEAIDELLPPRDEMVEALVSLYSSRRSPAPQYSNLSPAQTMLQSDELATMLPALRALPQ